MSRTFPVSTDRIVTQLTTNTDLRSYSMWVYRIGDGGGGVGRMWNKGDTTAASLDCQMNNNSAGTYDYNRRFSTSNGIWTVPRPSANEWHNLIVTHDMSSVDNDPFIFLDGVPQTTTETQTPVGTRANNTSGYMIGNRAALDRIWDGYLAEFAVWSRIIGPNEIIGVANGNPAWRYQTALESYVTFRLGTITDFVLAAPTATGTAEAPDPPFKRMPSRNNLRPMIFAPGRAR